MTKDGFIRELEECLQGEVSGSQLADSLDYYRSYIMEAEASGKTEDQVMEELGSTRLIARSIIDAYGEGDHPAVNEEYVQEGGNDEGEYGSGDTYVRHRRYGGTPTLAQKITGYVILIGALMVIGALFQLLMPVLAIGLVIWFIIKMLS